MFLFSCRYSVKPGEFDQGLGCLIRANDTNFQQSQVKVEVLDQLGAKFKYGDNEELIGNIISITPTGDEEQFKVSRVKQKPILNAYRYRLNNLNKAVTISGKDIVLKFNVQSKWLRL